MCELKGLGLSQRAGFGESGSDPDRNTARQVLEPSIGTLLARYRSKGGSKKKRILLRVCPACQVPNSEYYSMIQEKERKTAGGDI